MRLNRKSSDSPFVGIWLLSALLACQCSSKPRQPVNEIRQMITKVAQAAQAKSVTGVTEVLTEGFEGDGRAFGGRKSDLTRGIQMIFLRRGQIFVLPYLEYAEVDDKAENAVAKIVLVATDFKIEWEALNLDVRADVMDVSLDLVYDGDWKVTRARWKRSSLAYVIAEILQQQDTN